MKTGLAFSEKLLRVPLYCFHIGPQTPKKQSEKIFACNFSSCTFHNESSFGILTITIRDFQNRFPP